MLFVQHVRNGHIDDTERRHEPGCKCAPRGIELATTVAAVIWARNLSLQKGDGKRISAYLCISNISEKQTIMNLPSFIIVHIPLRCNKLLSTNKRHHISTTQQKRQTIKASSLEDSKRRAKSNYDNIPDLNQQYIRELAWIERKYGRDRLGNKKVIREASRSILAPSSPGQRIEEQEEQEEQDGNEVTDGDLKPYVKIKNRLLMDTLFVGSLGICITWFLGDVREVISFTTGLGLAIAYVALLARSVDKMADAAKQNGGAAVIDPLQAARVSLFVLAVVGAAKNTSTFSVVSVMLGFLTYKLGTLLPLLTGEAFDD